ncbi:MAG: 4'-phosphopantetheinyl transferase superfamily protein [Desulfobulbaceae bacterium]|uniref:4'-phosphopantetheinyl transferase superfamily protein n=1 Tax=Candidatus Desulfatifera sulfidica TaxID=2841691 RepID=A0A8J6N7Y6_9BACT|nr:4'-phosphopantetheinyl transferase superfamily protein [Candidatus Desulfatifera sulfidica]
MDLGINTQTTILEDLATLAGHSAGTTIHPCLIDLNKLGKITDHWGLMQISPQWLGHAELEILKTFQLRKRQLEWLGGRICAKEAARAFLATHPQAGSLTAQQLWIKKLDSGRPVLEISEAHRITGDLPDLSISHSGQHGITIAAGSSCGVDIQQITPTLERTRERFATPAELNIIQQTWPSSTELEQLALLWSAKEALKKAVGQKRMPGFLELILRTAQPKPKALGLLTFNRRDLPHLPLPQVAASLLSANYALALCAQTPVTRKPQDHA